MDIGGSDHASQAYLAAIQRVGHDLLSTFDALCRAHDIEYFVHAGTLLGCIREGGWIPWDDDVDVAIFRSQYERLRAVCDGAMPPGMRLSDSRMDRRHLSSIPKVLFLDSERDRTGRPRKFRPAENRHVALDLFILDTAPRSRVARTVWRRAISLCEKLVVARAMDVRHAVRAEKTHRALALTAVLGSRLLTTRAWRQVHYLLCVLPARLTRSPLVSLSNDFKPEFRELTWRWHDFRPPREGRFEGLDVPVPARAEEVLGAMYGRDYMTPPLHPSERQPMHLKEGIAIKLDDEWVRFPGRTSDPRSDG